MIHILLVFLTLGTPLAALDLPAKIDIVILGEVHDNGLHHQGQAGIIRDLHPKAVVFEMLSPEQAEIYNDGEHDGMDVLANALDWGNSGWPDFGLYQPIFEALNNLPVVGAAAPKSKVRRAFSDGAAFVFGESAAVYGLDAPISDAQLNTRKAMQFEAHCQAMPLDMMDGVVEAQRYRDAAFADATLKALESYGAPVVLIAGNGHARLDWGVPSMITVADPTIHTVSIGFVEEPASSDDPRFNQTMVTAAAERSDPCESFKN
jgi:uncharacterized iron-regulated protein